MAVVERFKQEVMYGLSAGTKKMAVLGRWPLCRGGRYWRFDGIYMGYWPSVRSRWLDIGQVLFLYVFIDLHSVSVHIHKLAKKKKERSQYPAITTEQA